MDRNGGRGGGRREREGGGGGGGGTDKWKGTILKKFQQKFKSFALSLSHRVFKD